MDLQGKRIMVAGVATGIGRATAIRVAKEGATVAAFDINDAEAQTTLKTIADSGGNAKYWHVDVTKETEVKSAVTQAVTWLGGGPDVLLHLVGISQGWNVDITEFTEELWDRVVNVNAKGPFLMSKHVAGHMQKAGKGVIVMVASVSGVIQGSSSYAYGASKGGAHGLSLVLAQHLGPKGIRVNDVCPRSILTPLNLGPIEAAFKRTGNREEYERSIKGLLPPEGVASVMAFLASDDADYVTGTIFTR